MSNIYMKYADIKGETKVKAVADWIGCDSFQWGVGRGISGGMGTASRREGSLPSMSEVVITKPFDGASAAMLQNMLKGKLDNKVEFKFLRTTEQTDYLHIELENAGISGFSMSTGGDTPSESVSINFTKITYNSKLTDTAGKVAQSPKVIYNSSTAKTG